MRIRFVLANTQYEVDIELPLIPDRGHTIHAQWLYSLINSQYDELPLKDLFVTAHFYVVDVIWKSDAVGIFIEVEIDDSDYHAEYQLWKPTR